MSLSRKYGQNGKTYHVPYSKGTDSTDRKNWDYWDNIIKGVTQGEQSWTTLNLESGQMERVESQAQSPIKNLIFTEKLDGQGNCFNQYGLFARSHGAPSELPWDRTLREKWALIKNDLASYDLELFGENMYACHSIEYLRVEQDYHVFAARIKDKWLSWEQVKEFAFLFDFPHAPEFSLRPSSDFKNQGELQAYVESLMGQQSVYGSIDFHSKEFDQMEGVVFRNTEEYHVNNFVHNVFKIVRQSHVKTDEHWTKNWRPAFKLWQLHLELVKETATDEEYRQAIINLEKKR
jgi:hypothetical protein